MKLHFGKFEHSRQSDPAEDVSARKESTGTEEGGMDEIAAAIAMAISMYMQDLHDNERAILTMQMAMKPYSPWSSKIYGLRELPLYVPRARK